MRVWRPVLMCRRDRQSKELPMLRRSASTLLRVQSLDFAYQTRKCTPRTARGLSATSVQGTEQRLPQTRHPLFLKVARTRRAVGATTSLSSAKRAASTGSLARMSPITTVSCRVTASKFRRAQFTLHTIPWPYFLLALMVGLVAVIHTSLLVRAPSFKLCHPVLFSRPPLQVDHFRP